MDINRRKEKKKRDRLGHLEKKNAQIMKVVKDTQRLINSFCAQNEILQECQVNMVRKMAAQQDREPAVFEENTNDPPELTENEMPRPTADARVFLEKRMAW